MSMTITVTKFSAGWNLPGCLPEMTPVVFDTEDEAKEFIDAEQREAAEIYAEDETADPYHYWVEPITFTLKEWAEYLAD